MELRRQVRSQMEFGNEEARYRLPFIDLTRDFPSYFFLFFFVTAFCDHRLLLFSPNM